MKKLSLALIMTGSLSLVSADVHQYDGYSYGSIGFENVTYKEFGTVSSKASGTSPLYTSGTLVRVNDRYDFSLDFASTLLPTTINEKWVSSSDGLLQHNDYDLLTNSAQLLVHYKFTPQHRFIAGPHYLLNTFKRYNWVKDNNAVILPVGVVEERISSLNMGAGYWYESKPAGVEGWRFHAKSFLDLPIWQQATNTDFEGANFDNTGGYNFDVTLYGGYTLLKGLEIGVYAGYNLQQRDGGEIPYMGGTLSWPENKLTSFRGGVQAVWNFSR